MNLVQNVYLFFKREWHPYPLPSDSSDRNISLIAQKTFVHIANYAISTFNWIRSYPIAVQQDRERTSKTTSHFTKTFVPNPLISSLKNENQQTHSEPSSNTFSEKPASVETTTSIPTSIHLEKGKTKIGDFYRFLTTEEIDKMKAQYHHPLKPIILDLIEKGDWANLIQRYKTLNNPKLFYEILDAAFLYNPSDKIDDLATAYIALSCADTFVKIDSFETISSQECNDWYDLERAIPKEMEGIAQNQLYFIRIDVKNMPENEQDFIKRGLFENQKRGGRKNEEVIGSFSHKTDPNQFLVSSSSLMRKDRRLHPEALLSFMHKMPRRSAVCKHLQKKEHVISFFHPNEIKDHRIHGVMPLGPLSFMHDGFHARVVTSSQLFQVAYLLDIGLEICNALEKLPKYSSPDVIDSSGSYRELNYKKFLTKTDSERFFLEEMVQSIIDGERFKALEWSFQEKKYLENTKPKVLESLIDRTSGNDFWLKKLPPTFEHLVEILQKHQFKITMSGYCIKIESTDPT